MTLTTRTAARVSLVGAIAFVGCTIAGIVAYPGGTRDDLGTHHYLFFKNFLSDLGGTYTASGLANGTARRFFIAAMIAVAVALVTLGFAARAWARGRIRWLAWFPLLVAALSGAAFIRAGTIPWNVDYYRHIDWVQAAFVLLGVLVFSITVLQLVGRAPVRWIAANAVFLLALGAYVVYDQKGPSIFTPDGVRAQATAQKIIVLLAIADLVAQAWALGRPRRDPQSDRRRRSAALIAGGPNTTASSSTMTPT
ncbi:MAG: hypothetical protein JO291_02355 [Acidimicrobiia bacterium]|nr:hypothetical protein [Acidimicrobiia bacterium]